MNFKGSKFILFFILFIVFAFQIATCLAEDPAKPTSDLLNLQVPIFNYSQAASLPEYIANIFKYAMIVLIPLASIMIIIAGISWIAAAGNQQKIKTAKDQISSALLGLILGLLTYTLLSFVGITKLQMQGIQNIEPMPIPVSDGEFEQTDSFNSAGNSGAPPVAGTMPRIFQCDYRNVPFNCSSKNVCKSGCGTVSATMILRYYGKNISVPQAVQFMGSGGYIGCSISGTSPSGFAAIAKANGLTYKTVPINFDSIKNLVASGKPIIANVGNRPPGGNRTCKYTGNGHYIVISGWDAPNNRFIINDPGGRAPNRYNGTWADLAEVCQFKGAYYIGP